MSDVHPPRASATPWHQAQLLAAGIANRLGAESVPLSHAVGRVLVGDLHALTDVPHYASAAMDGWATSGSGPWMLVAAASELTSGYATPIVTGGLIPIGTGSVLRSESGVLTPLATSAENPVTSRELSVAKDSGHLLSSSVSTEPIAGQHVRAPAREAHEGDVVITGGTVLNPAHISVAAVCGHDQLVVTRTPRVALLLTGDEVVVSGLPTPGKVRDSFSPQLPAFIGMLGGVVVHQRRVADSLEATVAALRSVLADCDVVISTGGTGDSPADFLHAALQDIGAEILVARVAMRPGGPTMLARTSSGVSIVALPGNPLAAMIGLLSVGAPLLAGLSGHPTAAALPVTAGHRFEGRPGTTILVPYQLDHGFAVSSQWLGSAMMRGLADAAGVLVIPPAGIHQGSPVERLALPWRASGSELSLS